MELLHDCRFNKQMELSMVQELLRARYFLSVYPRNLKKKWFKTRHWKYENWPKFNFG